MAASNNSYSSKEEKSQIKQIASAPTHNLTQSFAMTVKDWLCGVGNSFPLGRLGWELALQRWKSPYGLDPDYLLSYRQVISG